MNKTRGFTLVEMLVVIVIIGMLAGLLLPVLVKAKKHARVVRCGNNLHQLQLAVVQYTAVAGSYPCARSYSYYDHQEIERIVPGWLHWSTDSESGRTYYFDNSTALKNMARGTLWEYVDRSKGIFLCPAHHLENDDAVRSYAMSSFFIYGDPGVENNEGWYRWQRPFRLRDPITSDTDDLGLSGIVLFAEVAESSLDGETGSLYVSETEFEERHPDRTAIRVYADGHVVKDN